MMGLLTCTGPVMSDHGVAYCPDSNNEPTEDDCDLCQCAQQDALEEAADRHHDLAQEVMNRG